MNKPFPLIYREFKDAIVKAINDTRLDIGVVRLMLQPIMEEVNNLAEHEAKKQIEAYVAEQNKAEEVEVENEESLVKEENADESLEFDPVVD